MDDIEAYFSDGSLLLQKYNMGMILRPENVISTNPWFMVFTAQMDDLVRHISSDSMRFYFSADSRVQAYAIYDDQAIVLTAGMFDLLCKLASSIVGRGIYPAVGIVSGSDWDPDINKNLLSVRDLLKESSFYWGDIGPSWSANPDRMHLFFLLLRTMVKFVVLHEVGHLWHCHGDRRKPRDRFEVDASGPRQLPPQEALESQARELLADQFSFRALLRSQHSEIKNPPINQAESRVRQAVLSSPRDEIAFGLLAVYFYFYAVDRQDWNVEDTRLYSHPPAPFRLKTLMADIFEFGALEMSPNECKTIIAQANVAATAAVAATFQRFPDLNWMPVMDDKRLSKHYAQLFGEIPNWWRKI